MPGTIEVTSANFRLVSNPARYWRHVGLFETQRITFMLASVNLPAFDRNARLMMAMVGRKSPSETYARNGRTGAPVRRDRISAPGNDFFALTSSLTPEGEGPVSVMRSDVIAIYGRSAAAHGRGPVRRDRGLGDVDLGHGRERHRALGGRGQLRQESLVHRVVGNHAGELNWSGVARQEQVLSEARVQELLPGARGRRVRSVLGDRLGVVRRNRSVGRNH